MSTKGETPNYNVVDATSRDEYMSIVDGPGEGRVMLGDMEQHAVDVSVEELFGPDRVSKKAGTIHISGAGKYHTFVVEDGKLMGRRGATKTDHLTHVAKDGIMEDLSALYDEYVGSSTVESMSKSGNFMNSDNSSEPDLRELHNQEKPKTSHTLEMDWIDRKLEEEDAVIGPEAAEERLRQIHEEMGLEYDKTEYFPSETLEKQGNQKAN